MEQQEVIDKIKQALNLFYKKDKYLIDNNAHERSISHKLAEYLRPMFPDYNVDCEYDLHGDELKTLKGIKECFKRKKTERILPDIIIHERGPDVNNLAVIEIKSRTKATDCDIRKLELMTLKDGQFRYDYGFLIQFSKSRVGCQLKLYADGSEQ